MSATPFFNASRQVWLAGLGAAVVTRDWAQKEAGSVFRTLVKEGTVVESRTFRIVGDRLEDSFTKANTLWKRARRTVTHHGQAARRHRGDARARNLPELAAERRARSATSRAGDEAPGEARAQGGNAARKPCQAREAHA